jgi:hypothetical protein
VLCRSRTASRASGSENSSGTAAAEPHSEKRHIRTMLGESVTKSLRPVAARNAAAALPSRLESLPDTGH